VLLAENEKLTTENKKMTLQNNLFSSNDLGESLDKSKHFNAGGFNSSLGNANELLKLKSDYQDSELNNLKLQQRKIIS